MELNKEIEMNTKTMTKNQNSFAKVILSRNSKDDLKYSLTTTIEGFGSFDMGRWNITKEEWTEAIKTELESRN